MQIIEDLIKEMYGNVLPILEEYIRIKQEMIDEDKHVKDKMKEIKSDPDIPF